MPYDPVHHHRRSIRLSEYDYTQAGAYFVTLCTWNRECLFGEVVDGEMRLSEWGRIAAQEWQRTPDVRLGVKLDAFVVMPNHIHGIILIDPVADDPVGATRRVAPTEPPTLNHLAAPPEPPTLNHLGAPADSPPVEMNRPTALAAANATGGATRRGAPTEQPAAGPHGPNPGSLGAIIGQYKSLVAKQINRTRDTPGAPIWQRNYYEHIIRSGDELERIRIYATDNPAHWGRDRNNPVVIGSLTDANPRED